MAETGEITAVALDADDTLWHNERVFRLTEDRFADLLRGHAEPSHLAERLLAAERRNLALYGFGIKGFTLSMIETAIEVTENRVPATILRSILDAGRDMLSHPIETLPHVHETLEALAGRYRLIMVTKGDLFDQERKLAQSGLGEFFDAVEIVSDKTEVTYRRIFAAHGTGPAHGVMVGNSLKSDVIPAIAAGAWGIYVPHELTWVHEHAEAPVHEKRFRQVAHLGEVKTLLAELG